MAKPPSPGWVSGTVSGVTVGADGRLYEIQRGDRADPVVVMDRAGHVLRSWGRGDFVLPHSLRSDAQGNVWTVDAGSSRVIKYSAQGKKLLTIEVGGMPDTGSPFRGATDLAFGSKGNIFVADGYGNARVLEYSAVGKMVHQWGTPGAEAGEFQLPHAIQVDDRGIVYVADRENGRIEKFDQSGRYLGAIAGLGRVYALKVQAGAIWVSMGAFDRAPGAAGTWIAKLDRDSGRMLGHLDVPEAGGGHALDLMPGSEPIVTLGAGLLWFQPN